jgi:hypothetical protein
MTIDYWTPDADDGNIPNQALKAAIEVSLYDPFPTAELPSVAALKGWMSKPFSLWSDTLASLDVEQLNALVRFFTLAEANWTDWQGGDKNPAIWACKILKKHQAFPDKSFIEWIRAHSDNRFIPYGNVLG